MYIYIYIYVYTYIYIYIHIFGPSLAKASALSDGPLIHPVSITRFPIIIVTIIIIIVLVIINSN